MTARGPLQTKPALPTIAPCPCLGCKRKPSLRNGLFNAVIYVRCSCGWIGPKRKTPRVAIIAWNRRSDAETERRVAMAERAALKGDVEVVLAAWGVQYADKIVAEIFQGGEVLPAKMKKGARKR